MQLLLISIVIGIAIGFLVVSVMKSQLKSVRRQSGAANYFTAGSLNLTCSTDHFLYQNTTRTPRPKSNHKK